MTKTFKRLVSGCMAALLIGSSAGLLPASAETMTEIRIEAEDADEWGGWAMTREFSNASNGKVVAGANAHPYHIHYVAFTGWLSQLEPGDYTLTVSYMTGDPDMSLVARVNDEEHSIACPTTTQQDPWVKWEPGTVSTTITLIGNGMDELKFYEGVPGGVWIDYFTLKKVDSGAEAPATTTTAKETTTAAVKETTTTANTTTTTAPAGTSTSPEETGSTSEATSTGESSSETSAATSNPSQTDTVQPGESSDAPASTEPSVSPLPFIIIGIVVVLIGAGVAVYFLKFRKKDA